MRYKFRARLYVNGKWTVSGKSEPSGRNLSNDEARRIFRTDFTRARCFGADKILSIFCWANSPRVAKGLRKVLLGLEATGNGHVQYSRIGSTQHRFSTLKPLTQNELMRGLPR